VTSNSNKKGKRKRRILMSNRDRDWGNVQTPTHVRTVHKGFYWLELWDMPGVPYPCEVLRASDSVVGLLYDATNNRVLLVRQQRAPMVREDNPDGSITECVAGRFDVDLGPKALLVKEAMEEAGVEITEDDVFMLNDGVPMALSAGVLTERAYLCFAEIRPDKIEEGDHARGADEGESVTRAWVTVKELDLMVTGKSDQHFEDVRVLTLVQFLMLRLLCGSSKFDQ